MTNRNYAKHWVPITDDLPNYTDTLVLFGNCETPFVMILFKNDKGIWNSTDGEMTNDPPDPDYEDIPTHYRPDAFKLYDDETLE
jgi:hypothetical protein